MARIRFLSTQESLDSLLERNSACAEKIFVYGNVCVRMEHVPVLTHKNAKKLWFGKIKIEKLTYTFLLDAILESQSLEVIGLQHLIPP